MKNNLAKGKEVGLSCYTACILKDTKHFRHKRFWPNPSLPTHSPTYSYHFSWQSFSFQLAVYFHKEHFKTAIPLVITAMLVMYTLKGTISRSLPPTSYTKFIDIWLLYGILVPFKILVLIVLIEHLPDDSKVDKYSSLNILAESFQSFNNIIRLQNGYSTFRIKKVEFKKHLPWIHS